MAGKQRHEGGAAVHDGNGSTSFRPKKFIAASRYKNRIPINRWWDALGIAK